MPPLEAPARAPVRDVDSNNTTTTSTPIVASQRSGAYSGPAHCTHNHELPAADVSSSSTEQRPSSTAAGSYFETHATQPQGGIAGAESLHSGVVRIGGSRRATSDATQRATAVLTRPPLPSGVSSSSTPGAHVPDVARGVAAGGGTSSERAQSMRAGVIRSTADQLRALSSSILGSRQHKTEASAEGHAALPHAADASLIEESVNSTVADRPAGAADVSGGSAIDRYGAAEHAAAARGGQPVSDVRATSATGHVPA